MAPAAAPAAHPTLTVAAAASLRHDPGHSSALVCGQNPLDVHAELGAASPEHAPERVHLALLGEDGSSVGLVGLPELSELPSELPEVLSGSARLLSGLGAELSDLRLLLLAQIELLHDSGTVPHAVATPTPATGASLGVRCARDEECGQDDCAACENS